jgi:hypothetical protein
MKRLAAAALAAALVWPFVPAIATSPNTDFSVNALSTSGLTLLTTMPANPDRKGYIVQNQSAAAIVVEFVNPNGPSTYVILGAGTGANTAGASVDQGGLPHSDTIKVWGAGGSQVSAAQWN